MNGEAGLFVIASAFLGAAFGYFFALRAARRQSLRDSKQQAYGNTFPMIQEAIDIMGEILALEDLELKEGDKAQGILIRLMRPLWVLGIEDGISEASGHLQGFEGKKLTLDLLKNVRNTTGAWLLIEFYGILRDLRYDFAALELTPPSPDVKTILDRVLSMMGGDEITLSMRSLLRETGLSGMLSDVDLKERAEAYRAALGELREAIRADLTRTL